VVDDPNALVKNYIRSRIMNNVHGIGNGPVIGFYGPETIRKVYNNDDDHKDDYILQYIKLVFFYIFVYLFECYFHPLPDQ
jgi:hypothetical protein